MSKIQSTIIITESQIRLTQIGNAENNFSNVSILEQIWGSTASGSFGPKVRQAVQNSFQRPISSEKMVCSRLNDIKRGSGLEKCTKSVPFLCSANTCKAFFLLHNWLFLVGY